VDRTTQGIADVQLLALEPHADDRGSLTEVYRRAWVGGGREVVQANLTVSRPGVLRGLHWHRRQADYWCVLSGVAHVALVDLREGSPTRLATFERRVDAAAARVGLAIPPGVAHGFYAETEVLLQYLVDAPYTGDDEFGLAWDDPDLGLAWPSGDPILSDRDRRNPRLDDVLRDPPPYRADLRG
jgi:dTDP-4-dehydrorhamnose 3,5-epimerase